jgi:hypothetical protein
MNYNDYGTLLKQIPELGRFIKLSERAFEIYINAIEKNRHLALTPPQGIFNLLFFQAKNTSYSVRVLSTWAQPLEALALLRIRLEQAIISSYLFYEEYESGFGTYIKFMSDIERSAATILKKELDLNSFLKAIAPDFYGLLKSKLDDHENKYSNFDFKNDKPKKKWTNKSIFKLAKRRDELAPKNNMIKHISFEKYYQTLYKMASSIVHCDVSALSSNFVTTTPNGILIPHIFYVYSSLMECAHLDIIQCYELLNYFGVDRNKELEKLYKDFAIEIKEQFGFNLTI